MRAAHFVFAANFAASLCTAQKPPTRHSAGRHAKAAPAIATTSEIIFFNAVIYTGVGFAEDKPEVVQAMAIGGGKVLAVGTNEEVTRLAEPKTRLWDVDSNDISNFRAGSGNSDRELSGGSVFPQPRMSGLRRADDQTSTPEPYICLQSEGGLGRNQRRKDTFRVGGTV